eukprot:TRINITY_DN12200_c0_g1_i1.p1 TRINITY_DN12200_c0_g1~~TRINITY_DN12200_c0_g1_i1.p1  ORF type:complete len:583 (-),score=45.32 TRINITY_DN12200_c0_g1_i1:133-1881(-)
MTSLLLELTDLLQKQGLVQTNTTPITKDDVLLIIDMQHDFLPGGAFGVAEGHSTTSLITKAIEHCVDVQATVIATRDYHPEDHCSFTTHGGPFPPHCLQGSNGSFFDPLIGHSLMQAKKNEAQKVYIAFKGFSNATDSFGAVHYQQDYADTRLVHKGDSCALDFTGSFLLKCSNEMADINAPPDVLAWDNKLPILPILQSANRVFICGLAFDFCVLDTAINAAAAGLKNVHVMFDSSRAAHIPEIGQYGSGFLSDPAVIAKHFKDNNLQLVGTSCCVPGIGNAPTLTRATSSSSTSSNSSSTEGLTETQAAYLDSVRVVEKLIVQEEEATKLRLNMLYQRRDVFKMQASRKRIPPVVYSNHDANALITNIGPFGINPNVNIAVSLPTPPTDTAAGLWQLKGPKATLEFMREVQKEWEVLGTASPLSPVTLDAESKAKAAIPTAAEWFAFMYPVAGLQNTNWDTQALLDHSRTLLVIGGFMYFDGRGQLLQVNGIGSGDCLCFDGPYEFPPVLLAQLQASGRMQPVTLPSLREKVKEFAWLMVDEFAGQLKVPVTHGGFLYVHHDQNTPHHYFACVNRSEKGR